MHGFSSPCAATERFWKAARKPANGPASVWKPCGKVTVLPLDAGVFSAELEAITADYEESGGDYVENRQASAEILAQASRVEWIDG